jgi:flagellar hook capping protein FlgD
VEVACDFACFDMANDYFLVFEFLDANGPVGIPVDGSPQSCVNYNDWGSGYSDLVNGYAFDGDLFIWADVDCCGEATPAVSVTNPNGGEILSVGSSYDLSWSATVLTDVKIELSRDGGGAWETLYASTANDGLEAWAITGPSSDNCLLRVSSLDDLYSDVSDAPFSIYTPVTWLSVQPGSGSLALGESEQLIFGYNATGLTPGDYVAYAVITYNGVDSPAVVPVTLTIEDPLSTTGRTPGAFVLQGNHPNPFNPSTHIEFSLPATAAAVVDVIDLQGRVVRTIFSGELPAGPNSLQWNGRDDAGRLVGSGIYLARLRSAGRTATHKMLLAK